MSPNAENDRSASQDTMGALTADANYRLLLLVLRNAPHNELGWLSMVGLFLRNAPHNDLEWLQIVELFLRNVKICIK